MPSSPQTFADRPSKERARAIFILSVKSSGSSALQRRIAALSRARTLPYTTHCENETLYWTKVASILGLPQFRLPNSEVPFDAAEASAQLELLLRTNLPQFRGALLTESDFFHAWSQLVWRYGPILIEKSPHHLYQPAVLELMERYADTANDISVAFIGLVRNPIATMSSSWRRFGISPYIEEPHWVRAYRSLSALAKRRSDLLTIVRYEDLVSSDKVLARTLGVEPRPQDDTSHTNFHGNSIAKWKTDYKFGYQPSMETIEVARSYGYTENELQNQNAGPWLVHRVMRTVTYSTFRRLPRPMQDPIKSVVRKVRLAVRRLGRQQGGRGHMP